MKIRLPYEFEPRPYQQRFMDYYDHGGRNGIFMWHRRAGKDLVALHQTAKMAMQHVGMYWHCLPTYSQARKAVWNNFNNAIGKRLLRAVFPKQIVRHPDEFRPQAEMLIELINGSMIQLVGSDSIDNLVGTGPRHVTFSEYALCRPDSYDLVRPMLRESGGTVAFISTPRGKNHAWTTWTTAGKAKGWTRDLQTLHDTGAWRSWKDDEAGECFTSAQAVLDAEAAAGMLPELIRQEYLCDWNAALVGSVYGDLMETLEKAGRTTTEFGNGGSLYAYWDLGMNDSTACWLGEFVDGGENFVDHFEAHGKPLSYYFDEIEKRETSLGMKVVKHWLPHDARAKTLAAGISVEDQFRQRFGSGRVEIGPALSVLDGLQAGRWLLQRNTRFHPRCGIGLDALKQYHFEYDEKRKVYTNRPEHDWSSHSADAFRYAACVARVTERMSKPKTLIERPTGLVRSVYSFTLDELFEANERARRDRGRRIM